MNTEIPVNPYYGNHDQRPVETGLSGREPVQIMLYISIPPVPDYAPEITR